jgi:hypothetical protein
MSVNVREIILMCETHRQSYLGRSPNRKATSWPDLQNKPGNQPSHPSSNPVQDRAVTFKLRRTLLVRLLVGLAIIAHVSGNGDQSARLRTPDTLAQSRPPSNLDDKVNHLPSCQFTDLDVPIRVSGVIDCLDRVFRARRSEERLQGLSSGLEL